MKIQKDENDHLNHQNIMEINKLNDALDESKIEKERQMKLSEDMLDQ